MNIDRNYPVKVIGGDNMDKCYEYDYDCAICPFNDSCDYEIIQRTHKKDNVNLEK